MCIVRQYLAYSNYRVYLIADAPGKTGAPLVEDVDEDSVTLSWGKPRDDGGDEVQGYVVEVLEKGTNKWKPLNEKSPCQDNKYTGIYHVLPKNYTR